MQLPFYQSDSHSLPEMRQANKGLRFERFFTGYSLQEDNIKPKDEAKKDFLLKFNGACGNREMLQRHSIYQMQLAQSQNGNGKIYQLDGHFVTGMGNSHPVENGFLWHYTLGVPYLSGSQVKGLVRSLIEQYYQGENKKEILFKWFGSEDKDPKKASRDSQVGELIFFDAIPTTEPTLGVDIMTPHMGDWYAKGGAIHDVGQDSDKIPADWHDPVPIPFLAVQNANFLFTIAKRPGSEMEIEEVFACLDKALEYQGAGAKTQTGYGYMSFSKKATDDLREKVKEKQQKAKKMADLEKAKSSVSALHAQLLDEIDQKQWRIANDVAKGSFSDAIVNWLEQLKASSQEQDCARCLLEIAKIHYPAQVKNPHGKKVKPNQKEWILRLKELAGD